MEEKEILGLLSVLSINYPEVETIKVEGAGSGDSFDSFYEFTFTPDDCFSVGLENNMDLETLLWEAVNQSTANFDNEGSRVEILINLKTKKITIDTWFYVESEEHDEQITIVGNDDDIIDLIDNGDNEVSTIN